MIRKERDEMMERGEGRESLEIGRDTVCKRFERERERASSLDRAIFDEVVSECRLSSRLAHA